MLVDFLKWPAFPEVDILENSIIILYEDGSKQEWGIEEDTDPYEIASDIQNGLKAIIFLKQSVNHILNACLFMMTKVGFSKELCDEYLDAALRELLAPKEKPVDRETDMFYIE